MTGTTDPRQPSRAWHRFHAGAPLKSTYTKLPTRADCADCGWSQQAPDVSGAAMQEIRKAARDHAAIRHHRVVQHLAQEVTLEPKHPRTREKALETS